MFKDISEYIKTCEHCRQFKLPRVKTKAPLKITSTPSRAFEVVEIDIVGSLPITDSGNRYTLTIQDNFTYLVKTEYFSDATPLISFSAKDIAILSVYMVLLKS